MYIHHSLLAVYCSLFSPSHTPPQEFVAPQTELLFHIIAQPNSRDAVHSILGMTRQVGVVCDHMTVM